MALSVSPSNFREQLDVLSSYRVAPLSDLAASVSDEAVTQGTVAITFDDGYTDNLLHAFPALCERGVPATFFIASGHTASSQPFWWDRLERLLFDSDIKADSVELGFGNSTRRFDLDSEWNPSQNVPGWNVTSETDPSKNHTAFRAMHSFLREQTPETIDEALVKLETICSPRNQPNQESLPLTERQLIELASDQNVEIGAHTVSHPVLSAQSEARQSEELLRGKRALEQILGKEISLLAYPFGAQEDYNDNTIRLAREAGYKAACANFPRPVTKDSDPFALPRMVVRDWDGDEFARELNRFFRS